MSLADKLRNSIVVLYLFKDIDSNIYIEKEFVDVTVETPTDTLLFEAKSRYQELSKLDSGDSWTTSTVGFPIAVKQLDMRSSKGNKYIIATNVDFDKPDKIGTRLKEYELVNIPSAYIDEIRGMETYKNKPIKDSCPREPLSSDDFSILYIPGGDEVKLREGLCDHLNRKYGEDTRFRKIFLEGQTKLHSVVSVLLELIESTADYNKNQTSIQSFKNTNLIEWARFSIIDNDETKYFENFSNGRSHEEVNDDITRAYKFIRNHASFYSSKAYELAFEIETIDELNEYISDASYSEDEILAIKYIFAKR